MLERGRARTFGSTSTPVSDRSSGSGRSFARFATNVVLRSPRLWPLFRAARPQAVRRDRAGVGHDAQPTHSPRSRRRSPRSTAASRRRSTSAPARGRARLRSRSRFPDARVVGVDLAPEMLERGQAQDAGGLPNVCGSSTATRRRCRFLDASFDLVAAREHDPVLRRARPGRSRRAGHSCFAFSLGPGTPIYVPAERIREELAARGFTDFAEIEARPRLGFRQPASVKLPSTETFATRSTGPDVSLSVPGPVLRVRSDPVERVLQERDEEVEDERADAIHMNGCTSFARPWAARTTVKARKPDPDPVRDRERERHDHDRQRRARARSRGR